MARDMASVPPRLGSRRLWRGGRRRNREAELVARPEDLAQGDCVGVQFPLRTNPSASGTVVTAARTAI
jgi:hypothetical protein